MAAVIGAAIFAAIGASAVGATVIAGTTLATIVGGVILTAATIALQFLLMPKPSIPKPSDQFFPLRQPIPPRQTGYGEARLSGNYMFYETLDGHSEDVVALHHGKIKEFTRLYLHDDVVEVDPVTFVIVTSSQDNTYQGRVRIETRRGEETETAYSRLVTAANSFAASVGRQPMWTNNHRGDGIASLYLHCRSASPKNYPKAYPRGLPVPSVVARMSYLYDPRDVTQDRLDRATYEWSDNPIIATADYLTSEDYGMGLDWEECFGDGVDLGLQADICDENVPLKEGGTIKRYMVGGVFKHDNPPSEVLAKLLSTYDGWLAETGDGRLKLLAGRYVAPTITIRDAHVKSFSVQNGLADEEVINEFIPNYVSRDHDFSEVEGQPWRDEEDISERGKVKSEQVDLTWVQSHSQARRLVKRLSLSQSARVTGTLKLNLYGLVAVGERYLRLEIEDHPQLDGVVVEVIGPARIDFLDRSVSFEYRSVSTNEIDAWDASAEEGTPPTVSVKGSSGLPSPPANISVVVEGEEGKAIYADVTFDENQVDATLYTVFVRVAETGDTNFVELDFDESTITTSAGRSKLTLTSLSPSTKYEIKMTATRGNNVSTPSPIISFDTRIIAPASPDSFVYDPARGLLQWRAPQSASFVTSRVFRSAAGGTFASATEVSGAGGVTGAPGVTQTFSVSSSLYDYWVAAENAGALRSSPTGPVRVGDANIPGLPEGFEFTLDAGKAKYSARAATDDTATYDLVFYRGTPAQAVTDATLISSRIAPANTAVGFTEAAALSPNVYRGWVRGRARGGTLGSARQSTADLIVSGQTFSETFAYADGAIETVGASNWTRLNGSAGAATVASGVLQSSVAMATPGTVYSGPDLFAPNLYLEAETRHTVGSNNGILAFVIDVDNYVLVRNTSTGNWSMLQRVGGVSAAIYSVAGTVAAPGTIVRLEKVGDVFTLKVGGTTIDTPRTITGLAPAKRPGVVIITAAGAFIDNYKAGIL